MKGRALTYTTRGLALVVSAVILALAVSRLSSAKLLATLEHSDWRWFAAAVLANGVLFIPAAMRWQIVLRIANVAVDFGTTLRCVLIGHLFYVGLFGAAGGDTARSVCYSRWFDKPLAAVLATAPLDRLLGFLGLLLFGSIGLASAFWSGGFRGLSVQLPSNMGVWAIVLLAALILCIALWRFAAKQFAAAFFSSLREGFVRLIRSPGPALAGLVGGVLVQCALSAVLALNIEAVVRAPIPWAQLLWTFPVISLLGGLPITVAGLGTREAASLTLLGLYGIPGEAALAASLLCFAATLIWALCGGLFFWSQERRFSTSNQPRTAGAGRPLDNLGPSR